MRQPSELHVLNKFFLECVDWTSPLSVSTKFGEVQLHIHRSNADDINAGILEPRQIEQARGYASFREALAHFCTMIHLEKSDDHFPGLSQSQLFSADEADL